MQITSKYVVKYPNLSLECINSTLLQTTITKLRSNHIESLKFIDGVMTYSVYLVYILLSSFCQLFSDLRQLLDELRFFWMIIELWSIGLGIAFPYIFSEVPNALECKVWKWNMHLDYSKCSFRIISSRTYLYEMKNSYLT